MQNHISKEFGINSQVLAILQLLAAEDIAKFIPYDNESEGVYTSPWYNGREKGICLSFYYKFNECINVIITNSRNSDSIVVYNWESKISINPPTVNDFSDIIYDNGKYFEAYDFKSVIDYVVKLSNNFYYNF